MPIVTTNTTTHGSVRLSDEQILLRDAVRILADELVAPRAAAIDREAALPDDMRRLLADHDVFAIPFAAHTGVSVPTCSRSASRSRS